MLPRLAVLTGAAFALMTVAVPLPGGTTAHAGGVALLALTFGVGTAFVCVSLVLLLQAALFGDGGLTTLPVNALAMGLLGAATARGAYAMLRRWSGRVAAFVAGLLTIHWFLRLVARGRLHWFGWYCLAAGTVALALLA